MTWTRYLRCILLVICLATIPTLIWPRYTCAAECGIGLTNKVGDTITGTVTLFGGDPGEDDEGESLFVRSSGREYFLDLPFYNSPYPFSYIATTANETLV